jgi:hypothetical protein
MLSLTGSGLAEAQPLHVGKLPQPLMKQQAVVMVH